MKKIFVAGTFELLHAGHIQFLRQAKNLGDFLVVCFRSSQNIFKHRGRHSVMPDDHRIVLLSSLKYVDKVIVGDERLNTLHFAASFVEEKPDVLAVSEDDDFMETKLELCQHYGVRMATIPRIAPLARPLTVQEIINNFAKSGVA